MYSIDYLTEIAVFISRTKEFQAFYKYQGEMEMYVILRQYRPMEEDEEKVLNVASTHIGEVILRQRPKDE
jgi:hypothetical protein